MPYIPTETIISAAILAALTAGWRYVQQNPQQELIPASVKKTAQSALSNGKGLFEDELTGESSKKAKAGGKKSGSSKKKSKGGAGSTAPVKAISETEEEQEKASASPVEVKSTKQKKPQTLAEKKVKKAPKTEVDDMLPDDQKQPHLARVMKIVPEPTSSSSYSAVAAPHPSDDPSTSAPVASPAQGKTDSSSDEGRKEEFGYEDEDEIEEEGRKEEDDGWEVPKKFVGGANASSFASAAASSRAPSAPTLNRFSLLTDSNPNFQSSSSSRRKPTSSTSRSTQPEQSATPTKIQRKNANKRDAQKAQKEQEEKERLDRLKSYRAEAAKDRAGAGGKKDALGRGVENWSR